MHQWKPVINITCPDCCSDEIEAYSENTEPWEIDVCDELRCKVCGKRGHYLCCDDFNEECWDEWDD